MEIKKVLLASSAALALTAASSAQADDYFTVFGGATFQSDVDAQNRFTYTNGGLTSTIGLKYYHTTYILDVSASAEHEAGFVLGAAYGRNLNPAWRMELELAYRESPVEDSGDLQLTKVLYYTKWATGGTTLTAITKGPATGTATNVDFDGSTSFFSVMANVWYDFNIAGPWETFVGAGLGMAQANVNDLRVGTGTKGYQLADGTDWVFAYQFGVGAGYNLENGVRLSAQYRYFGTDEAEIDGVDLQGEASEFLFGISFPLGN